MTVLSGEIAYDRVRFPEHEPFVVDRWDQAVRIELAVFGGIHDAEIAAGVDAPIREPHLLAAPQRLLHVYRVVPSPNDEHR